MANHDAGIVTGRCGAATEERLGSKTGAGWGRDWGPEPRPGLVGLEWRLYQAMNDVNDSKLWYFSLPMIGRSTNC